MLNMAFLLQFRQPCSLDNACLTAVLLCQMMNDYYNILSIKWHEDIDFEA